MIVRLHRWWRRRKDRNRLVEQCAVCDKWLKRREVRELRSTPEDDALLGISAYGGGSFMAETYCAEHYPG